VSTQRDDSLLEGKQPSRCFRSVLGCLLLCGAVTAVAGPPPPTLHCAGAAQSTEPGQERTKKQSTNESCPSPQLHVRSNPPANVSRRWDPMISLAPRHPRYFVSGFGCANHAIEDSQPCLIGGSKGRRPTLACAQRSLAGWKMIRGPGWTTRAARSQSPAARDSFFIRFFNSGARCEMADSEGAALRAFDSDSPIAPFILLKDS
jgi:hypothetical protein